MAVSFTRIAFLIFPGSFCQSIFAVDAPFACNGISDVVLSLYVSDITDIVEFLIFQFCEDIYLLEHALRGIVPFLMSVPGHNVETIPSCLVFVTLVF